MAGIGAKLPSQKIRAVGSISGNQGAISAGGNKDDGVRLLLELNPEFSTKNLLGELMEKKGENLFITIEKYNPSIHDGLILNSNSE